MKEYCISIPWQINPTSLKHPVYLSAVQRRMERNVHEDLAPCHAPPIPVEKDESDLFVEAICVEFGHVRNIPFITLAYDIAERVQCGNFIGRLGFLRTSQTGRE